MLARARIGEACPSPTAIFHFKLSFSGQVDGSPVITPSRCGPRHSGQSAPFNAPAISRQVPMILRIRLTPQHRTKMRFGWADEQSAGPILASLGMAVTTGFKVISAVAIPAGL